MRLVRFNSKQFEKLCGRNCTRKKRVQDSVKKIIDCVFIHGDNAILKYTRRFDKIALKPNRIRVSEGEMNGAYQDIKPEFVNVLKMASDNITRFYQRQMRSPGRSKTGNTGYCWPRRSSPSNPWVSMCRAARLL